MEIFSSFLMGASLQSHEWVDFLEGLTEEQIQEGFKDFKPMQAQQAKPILRRVPEGILMMTGPAGSGKTSASVTLVKLLRMKGGIIGGFASANSAANHYCERTSKVFSPEEHLMFRLWTESVELNMLKKCNPDSVLQFLREDPKPTITLQKKKMVAARAAVNNTKRVGDYYIFGSSCCATVCRLVGMLPTENPILLELDHA
jgi:hypothetical protein